MTGRDDSSEGFLGRWSRKKIEGENEGPDAPRTTDVPTPDEPGLPGRRADAKTDAKTGAKTPAKATPHPEFDLASLPSLEFDHGGHRRPRLPFAGRAEGTCPCGPSPRVVGRSGDPGLRRPGGECLGLHRSHGDGGIRRAAAGLRRQKTGGADFRRWRKADRSRRRRAEPADAQASHIAEEIVTPPSPAEAAPESSQDDEPGLPRLGGRTADCSKRFGAAR